MNVVGRRQVKMLNTHPPIQAGRCPKSFPERAGERLQRTVVGVQRNIGYGRFGVRQLIGSSFQQEPPSHGCRSFFDNRSEQPVELRAALIGRARRPNQPVPTPPRHSFIRGPIRGRPAGVGAFDAGFGGPARHLRLGRF